ncbi:uncharacterized protein TNCT_716491 [Trichonephila clavata]|uniref:Uncharacterized protein n=1 Tax=Trichonephila clavata TaxID=2740835 RepID=A0A8X6LMD7_TRICU|nr:uncharacterized protein TNCT_716491 [Trichonephila clavata]
MVTTEKTELEVGTVATRVDSLGVSGFWYRNYCYHKKDLLPGISVERPSTIYLKGIVGPAVKCPLVYFLIGLATGGQVNMGHQQMLCALVEVFIKDVLLPPDVLDMLRGARMKKIPWLEAFRTF